MTKLTKEEVKRLAQLSRISLTDTEVESLRSELSAILDLADQLKVVNTDGVETTAQVTGLVNVMRPDEVKDYGPSREELLANTPETEKGYIKVHRVLKGKKQS